VTSYRVQYSNLRDVSAVNKNTNKRKWDSKGERTSEGSEPSQRWRDFRLCIRKPRRLIPWPALNWVFCRSYPGWFFASCRKKLVGKICSRDNNDVERILCAANCQSRKGPNWAMNNFIVGSGCLWDSTLWGVKRPRWTWWSQTIIGLTFFGQQPWHYLKGSWHVNWDGSGARWQVQSTVRLPRLGERWRVHNTNIRFQFRTKEFKPNRKSHGTWAPPCYVPYGPVT